MGIFAGRGDAGDEKDAGENGDDGDEISVKKPLRMGRFFLFPRGVEGVLPLTGR